MSTGFIKLYRCLKQSSFYKDSEYVHLWVHLLMSVNRTQKRLKVEKTSQYIDLMPGQVLTSRDKLSEQTGISSSKVQRILKTFESEQQIEQQTFSKYRVISITKWQQYQQGEQQNEQQVNGNRTASEQQVNTNKNEEKEKKETTATGANRTEQVFLAAFNAKEERLKELFPQHNYEVVKESCLAYYRGQPPPADAYPAIVRWFQREQITPPHFTARHQKPKRGLTDDFEKTFLGTDEEA